MAARRKSRQAIEVSLIPPIAPTRARAVREIDVRFAFKRVKGRKQKDRSYKVGTVDVCGQIYTILVDPDLELEGCCEYSTCTIRLFEQAPERMREVLFHEIMHAILDAYGIGWSLRQRLKLTREEWRAFEEDHIIRPLSPAIMATFRRAGWLSLPKFSTRKRHRSSR